MNPHKAGRLLLLVPATFSGFLLVSAQPLAVAAHFPGGSGATSTDNSGGSLVFTISGDTSGPISPGTSATINLTFENAYGFALSVTHVKVAIRSVTAPNADAAHPCSIADFKAVQSKAPYAVVVPARHKLSLSSSQVPPGNWPSVAMVNSTANQDGCKGATVSLGYAAVGKRHR